MNRVLQQNIKCDFKKCLPPPNPKVHSENDKTSG